VDDVNQDCGPEDPHLEAPDGDLVVARSHVTLAVVLRPPSKCYDGMKDSMLLLSLLLVSISVRGCTVRFVEGWKGDDI